MDNEEQIRHGANNKPHEITDEVLIENNYLSDFAHHSTFCESLLKVGTPRQTTLCSIAGERPTNPIDFNQFINSRLHKDGAPQRTYHSSTQGEKKATRKGGGRAESGHTSILRVIS